MATSFPEFAPFDAENRENVEIRRQRWFMRFENLLIALDIKDNKKKRAFILHYMGDHLLQLSLKHSQKLALQLTMIKPVKL